ncbi:hypothetical protein INT45_006414 [Circinella minor]|uniref:F-box domain-containing protein n=1 Tax=Circinella minor TaxID=1195481 RepID=A0A8H7SF49_9FUNG|nr:hypothetical protein INT45_006414 [Circinella minor]
MEICDITHKNELAVLFLKCAIIAILQDNLYLSLDNAYQSIGLAPQIAQGYICAAQALLSLAKYNDVVDICDRGLSPQQIGTSTNSNNKDYDSVLSSTSTTTELSQYHELLKSLKHEALLQVSRTTTTGILVEKLPIELLEDIFMNLLSAQDRLVCVRVCNSWRKFILDEVPQFSHELVLEYMPESVMGRMVASTPEHGKVRKIVIQFDDYDYFEATSLKLKAFDLLLQYKCTHIEKLEFRGDPNDGIPSVRKKIIQFLQDNKDTLKEIVIHENVLPQFIFDVIISCPNIIYIYSSTKESPLRQIFMQQREQLYRQQKNRYSSSKTKYDNMKRMQFITRSHAAKVYDEYAERGSIIDDDKVKQMENQHTSLTYLEIEGLPIPAFREPFWQKVFYLQHLILGEPRTPHLLDEVQVRLLHALNLHCPNLITLRCGYHFKTKPILSVCNNTSKNYNGSDCYSIEEKGFRELTLRPMIYQSHMLAKACLGMNGIGSLIQKSFNTLQVLHLPIEVFNIHVSSILNTLPHLYELGLYMDRTVGGRHHDHEDNMLKPQQARMIVQKCSLLTVIVLTAPTSDEALFELTKLSQLHRVYFINSTFEYFTNSQSRDNVKSLLESGYEPFTSAQLFFENCTTLQEVTVRGPFFTNHDLRQLVANNSQLTKLSLHGCDQLTIDGITAALDVTTNLLLCSFTFVKLYTDMDLYRLLMALPKSIIEITIVVVARNDEMHDSQYICRCLKQAMETCDTFCPEVRVLLQTNDGIRMSIFHCISGKGVVKVEKDKNEANTIRMRMFADIL